MKINVFIFEWFISNKYVYLLVVKPTVK